jgi:integrase
MAKTATLKVAGADSSWDYWSKRVVRKIRGVTVSFYRRFEHSDVYTLDCKVAGRRVRLRLEATTVKEAEGIAVLEIKRLQEASNGVAVSRAVTARGRQGVATVDEVLTRLLGGDKVAEVRTLRTYGSSLLRVARVADAGRARGLKLDGVLSQANLERFFSKGQGRTTGVNWVDHLPQNGGLMSAIRNLRALFTAKFCSDRFGDLVLPDLEPLRSLRGLPVEHKGFVPWDEEVYRAMDEASLKLKEEQPELWLVNAMLRRTGVRDAELLAARRDWIEEDAATGRAWLVIKNRGEEFKVLKHGRAYRRLELDEELKGVLLPKVGWLITAPAQVNEPGTGTRTSSGEAPWARYDFIYRDHCDWLRQFIPDRVKANHELRMYAGSLVFKRDGLAAASYFLGHKSVVTTERYYVAYLGETPMLDGAAVASAGR